jgi:hypothetical protein
MSPITGEIVTKEEMSHEEALAKAIVSALGEFINLRTQDLPHRFKAPSSLAQYMADWGTNSTYYMAQVLTSNPANPISLEITTRPTQKILEMVFTSADGMRLFTLEIEYGDAISQKREVLLSWREAIHKKADHRNTPRKGSATKAS